MNCAKCQNHALVSDVRRGRITDCGQISRIRRRCLECDPDSLSGCGMSRVQATEFTLALPRADGYTTEPSGQATDLPPEAEHRFRLALATIFGLDPMDLLILQHIMRGNKMESFKTVLGSLVARSRKYHGRTSARVYERVQRILERFDANGGNSKL